MAITLPTGKFACSICGTEYASVQHADACRDAHEYIYIPMTATELNRLIHAINFGDFSVVPESLFQTLRKYSRSQVTRK